VMTTGLLLTAPSAEAVAGVLAHELAHVTERHGMRALLREAGLGLLLSLVVGDAAGAGSVLLENASALTGLSHTREMERAADLEAVALLRRAERDPRGLVAMLRELAKREAEGAQLPAFLSSHPLSSERLERLEALTRDAAEKPAPQVDFAALQAAVRELAKPR
jgi:beta-barrel assembly-enhancing protease